MKRSLIISKTLSDTLNGKEPSQEMMKALQLGERKSVDGINYIVKQTPSGLGWRVDYTKKSRKKKKGRLLKGNDLFENEDFPNFEDIEFVENLPSSSTGAKLVKDKNTNTLYVLKKGASPDHIREEFLANSIYKLFDVNVPVLKLYEEGEDVFMLSEFIEESVPVNSMMDEQFREDIMQDYVLDCFLGNWDIYKNDNIRVDTNLGELCRVDNGGCLRFSAQGRDKGKYFFDDVDEIESMLKNNPEYDEFIEFKQIKSQIRYILKHRNEILSLIDNESLRTKMSNRLDDLKDRISKQDNDPYRKLKERELRQALDDSNGQITHTGANGWTFLSEICKLRGFDGKPEVVDEKEFNKLVSKKDSILIHRGLTGGYNRTAKDFMDDFATGEDCFYGTQAMYGAGVYAAVNKTKTITDPPNSDYEIALSYAGYDKNHVMDIAVSSDVKIIDANELDDMMNEEFFGEEFQEKKKEYDAERDKLNSLLVEKEAEEKIISDRVKDSLGWNEKTWRYLRRSKPEEIFADLSKDNFPKALKYFSTMVSSINGRVDKLDDNNYEVHLPNSNQTHIINKNVAFRALKQKNDFTTPYNYHYKLLKEFIHKNHFKIIQNEVTKEIDRETKQDPKLNKIHTDLKDQHETINKLSEEINSLKTSGSATLNDVMAEIVKHPHGTHRGFYAAIKGYDMIVQKNGWGGSTDFAVILNRSKMIVKKFN